MDETSARLACQFLLLSGQSLVNGLSALGSAKAVLDAPKSKLKQYFSAKQIDRIESWRSTPIHVKAKRLAEANDSMQGLHAHIIAISDEEYPRLLREIPDPPPLLSVIGDAAKLLEPQIAIVGSRKMTPAGGALASKFAQRLASAGITITSGLALGIDTHAHQGALAVGGTTIAVLGTGIDKRYPASNSGLYGNIVSEGGLILSEYPLGTPPRPANFPKRNRIITGLSMGTLVVEASERSGSLVSARLAAEQGREVFAVPGSILSPASSGCHKLIREGATLVTEPQHILEGISNMFGALVEPPSIVEREDVGEEKIPASSSAGITNWLLEALAHECLSADQLCDRTAKSAQEVSSMLAQLELDGEVVASQFGYQRIR